MKVTNQPILRGSSFRRAATIAVIAVTLLPTAWAAKYDVKHNFRLRPGGNIVPRVTASYYAHSYIQEKKGDCQDFAIEPSQGAAHNPYGRDSLRSRGRVRNRGVDGRYRNADNGTLPVGAGGINTSISAFTAGCLSWADANCDITVNPLSAGGRVTGTIRSWGEAKAALRPPRRSKAYAFSMTMVEAQGGRAMRNGNIRWGRVVRDVVAGRAGSRRQVDPIEYTVTDKVTGKVHQGLLYTATIDILKRGGGGFLWENDKAEITALDVDLYLEFPTRLTSLQGKLDLRIRNGKVTHAESTGTYAGKLPPVGTRVPITLDLPNTEEFDYDLGDFEGHDIDVNMEFSGSGEAEESRSADPELTVTRTQVTPDAVPSVTLSFDQQNVPVVIQQSTNLAVWDDTDIVHVLTEATPDGQHHITVPVLPGENMFFRLRTEEERVLDLDAPKFHAEAVCGQPMVLLSFTEPINHELALDPFLYQVLDPEMGLPNPVLELQPLPPDTVMLFLEQPIQPELQLQAVILGGITDLAGNEMRPNYAMPIQCEPAPNDRELPLERGDQDIPRIPLPQPLPPIDPAQ